MAEAAITPASGEGDGPTDGTAWDWIAAVEFGGGVIEGIGDIGSEGVGDTAPAQPAAIATTISRSDRTTLIVPIDG